MDKYEKIDFDQERGLLSSPTRDPETNKPPKRLGGASRKRLSRLLSSGIPYEIALNQILEQREQNLRERKQTPSEQVGFSKRLHSNNYSPKPEAKKPCTAVSDVSYRSASHQIYERREQNLRLERKQTPSEHVGFSKRLRSNNYSPNAAAKRPCQAEYDVSSGDTDLRKPSYGKVAAGIKVGIVHLEHPATSIPTNQLKSLQSAIMAAIEDIPEDGPQVRFQSCTFRSGWLQITCEDQESVSWLVDVVDTLQPWEGAYLKCVPGNQLPKPHICVAYLPDEGGNRLTADQVLTRLRKMNHGLNTLEWTVLHKEISGPGQTWTFVIDDGSMVELERMGFRPYFGFGQVLFRPKNRTPSQQVAAEPGPSKKFNRAGKPPTTSGHSSNYRQTFNTPRPLHMSLARGSRMN